MKHLREKFEVMSEIAELMEDVCYDDDRDMYDAKKAHWSSHEMSALFVNGAWYMFKEQYKIQQEQHNEILELQNKLSKLKETADWHIEDCSCNHPMSQYQLGWFEAMSLVKEILK